MNYKQSKIILLVSALTLVSCYLSQNVVAKPLQQQDLYTTPSIVPNRSNTGNSATFLTYKIETYDSQLMGANCTYGVSLPPGYEQNPKQKYPVIFLLHGGHGNPSDWFIQSKGQALKTMEQLYATGKLPPSIIITNVK